jgi:hypothetical protein
MNSMKRKSVIAAVMLAVGMTAFGAQAAGSATSTESPRFEGFENQLSAGSVANYTASETGTVVAAKPAKKESRQFENFENQLSAGTVANYSPAEHPADAQRRSSTTLPSPFDAYDLASPGG